MPQTIFFSWQADTSTREGRNFIERALERALGRIEADTELEEAVRDFEIDRDTKGVAGSPPIVDTIFKKIDAAAVFLPDLTFVGKRLDGRPTPNPNVLIEYGWALKSLGHSFMLPVMNTAYGEPTAEDMPFDMRHLRNPIAFHCPEDANDATRKAVREKLSKELEGGIRAILRAGASVVPPSPEPSAFPRQVTADRPGRFRKDGEPVGIDEHPFGASAKVNLTDDPTVWLRVMPKHDTGKTWSVSELRAVATTPSVMRPLNRNWTNLGYVRGPDGFGVYPPTGREAEPTYGMVFAFKTAEIWSIDTFWVSDRKYYGKLCFYLNENAFAEALTEYGRIIERLGVSGPYLWIAGIEKLKDHSLLMPRRKGYIYSSNGMAGKYMGDDLVTEGFYDLSNDPIASLKPFFEAVYERFGLQRPEWLDTQRAID